MAQICLSRLFRKKGETCWTSSLFRLLGFKDQGGERVVLWGQADLHRIKERIRAFEDQLTCSFADVAIGVRTNSDSWTSDVVVQDLHGFSKFNRQFATLCTGACTKVRILDGQCHCQGNKRRNDVTLRLADIGNMFRVRHWSAKISWTEETGIVLAMSCAGSSMMLWVSTHCETPCCVPMASALVNLRLGIFASCYGGTKIAWSFAFEGIEHVGNVWQCTSFRSCERRVQLPTAHVRYNVTKIDMRCVQLVVHKSAHFNGTWMVYHSTCCKRKLSSFQGLLVAIPIEMAGTSESELTMWEQILALCLLLGWLWSKRDQIRLCSESSL